MTSSFLFSVLMETTRMQTPLSVERQNEECGRKLRFPPALAWLVERLHQAKMVSPFGKKLSKGQL
jgi:hypothetical protein